MAGRSELERWQCVGDFLFAPFPKGTPGDEQYFVEHNCYGTGWGNSVRALFTTASLALLTGRRLIIRNHAFERTFLQPSHPNVSDWVHNSPVLHDNDIFSYADHGQHEGDFLKWVNVLKTKPVKAMNNGVKHVMGGGMCGGWRPPMTDTDCLDSVLPHFMHHCVRHGNIDDDQIQVPFFYTTFARPSSVMVNALRKVRRRLNLPILAPGLEHAPGAWGLRTPGYYIVSMHFRNIPDGFEPFTLDAERRQRRIDLYVGFLQHAVQYAKEATKVAACRNETLLMYFASDDIKLRAQATKELSPYARVVFGLDESEVGHMTPQFREDDEKKREEIANFSMVEWWILANSNWLLSTFETSFSRVVAGWGMGPRGVMERMDIIQGNYPGSQVTRRRDWFAPGCNQVYAADPAHRKSCPVP